jgi:hypothetical protein
MLRARLLDTGTAYAFTELWVEQEPRWEGPFGIIAGKEAIRDAISGYAQSPILRNPSRGHWVYVLGITVEGDRVQAQSRWALIRQVTTDNAIVDGTGFYEDEFIREGGKWKFKHRSIRSLP